jgi:hypothetical protein
MAKKYVFDDYGQKYESLDKDEINGLIATGVERNTFSGSVTFENNIISFDYSGTLPSEEILIKLLNAGVYYDNTEKQLTEKEISDILALPDFSINFYYIDTNLYATNANKNYISLVKDGVGRLDLYPKKRELGYFIKSNKKMKNIEYLRKDEFNNIIKDSSTLYVIGDEDYTQNIILNFEVVGSNLVCYTTDLKGLLSNNALDRFVVEVIRGGKSKEGKWDEYLTPASKFYNSDLACTYYRFRNGTHELDLSIGDDGTISYSLGLIKPENALNADYATNAQTATNYSTSTGQTQNINSAISDLVSKQQTMSSNIGLLKTRVTKIENEYKLHWTTLDLLKAGERVYEYTDDTGVRIRRYICEVYYVYEISAKMLPRRVRVNFEYINKNAYYDGIFIVDKAWFFDSDRNLQIITASSNPLGGKFECLVADYVVDEE